MAKRQSDGESEDDFYGVEITCLQDGTIKKRARGGFAPRAMTAVELVPWIRLAEKLIAIEVAPPDESPCIAC